MAAIGRQILMKPYGHGLRNNQVISAFFRISSLDIAEIRGFKFVSSTVVLTLSTVCGLPTKMNSTNSVSVKYGKEF